MTAHTLPQLYTTVTLKRCTMAAGLVDFHCYSSRVFRWLRLTWRPVRQVRGNVWQNNLWYVIPVPQRDGLHAHQCNLTGVYDKI